MRLLIPMLLVAFLPALDMGGAGATVASDAVPITVSGSPLGAITTAAGPLTPAFSQTISDYTVRCSQGINSVTLQLTAANGGAIQVGSQSGQSISIPVSLIENQAVTLTAAGDRQYWIRCLPHDFPALAVNRQASSTPGWYLTGNVVIGSGEQGYAMILNGNGTPVWYQKSALGAVNVEPGPNNTNTVAWDDFTDGYGIHQLDGSGVQPVTTVGTPADIHELQYLPNGNHVMLTNPVVTGVDLTSIGLGTNQTIGDCDVQELDPDGKLVWQWRAYVDHHVDASESVEHPLVPVPGGTAYDLFHCNSVDVSSTGDVMVSARHMNAVFLINASGTNTGVVKDDIVWKLGGTATNKDGAKILQIVGDDEATIYGQHDARFLPPPNSQWQCPGVLPCISLYDDHSFGPGPARALEYQVDLPNGNANLEWQYKAPTSTTVAENSAATGSFRRYPDGDSLIGWGIMSGADFGLPGNAGFSEVDQSGNLLWELSFPAGDALYRAIKVPISRFDINVLRQTAGLPRDSQYTGTIDQHWWQLGGPDSPEALPTSSQSFAPDGIGQFEAFQYGSIYWTPSTGAWEVHGNVDAHWAALGWERSVVGYPITDETGTPDGVGRFNHFQFGSIYWTPSTGAWEVHGSIGVTWAGLGYETSVLGYPITDETGTPDGVGRFNHFQFGSIYWTPSTGAWEVHGNIDAHWAALGWERSVVGYPITDETGTPDGVGRFNHFQFGSIYWTPSTGAWEVHGSIGVTWAGLGYETSVLGYPITDETGTPDGVGRFNHFQFGSIYWTPSTGAWEVHGNIDAHWAALGWERSVLGYPVSNETGTPDGIGRYNNFQNGSIYWTPSTGPWEVHGAIRAHWGGLGWERSVLGYPTSDETGLPDGVGRYNTFQNGNVYWSPATGAWELHGPILSAFLSVQATQSQLGYPISDVTPTPSGATSFFEGGHIDWNSTTNQTTITYS